MLHLDNAYQKSITHLQTMQNCYPNIYIYIYIYIYIMLKYSDNYTMTSRGLWNYCRDKVNDDESDNDNNDRLNNNKTITSKSFKQKTKIIGSTSHNESRLNAEVVVSLKELINFW